MGTSKAKATSKPKKTAATVKTTGSRQATIGKSGPSEEEIRKKAMELYNDRISRGEHGTAEEDWLKAELLLGDSVK